MLRPHSPLAEPRRLAGASLLAGRQSFLGTRRAQIVRGCRELRVGVMSE